MIMVSQKYSASFFFLHNCMIVDFCFAFKFITESISTCSISTAILFPAYLINVFIIANSQAALFHIRCVSYVANSGSRKGLAQIH